MKLYSVKDAKAVCFGAPVPFRNHADAIRTFNDAVFSGQTVFSKHPADFELWFLGEMDEDTGVFKQGIPEFVAIYDGDRKREHYVLDSDEELQEAVKNDA